MPFSESTKQEARSKSGYACCICHESSISIEVHHIIPQENSGSDTIDNAAPLCPNCHSDFGGNPEKVKRVKEMRDWWYKKVENMYPANESNLIREMSIDLSNIKEKLPDIKNALSEFTKLRIQQMTPENAQMAVSGIVSSTTSILSGYNPQVQATKLSDKLYANMKCKKCGTQIGLLIGTNKCPGCSFPINI